MVRSLVVDATGISQRSLWKAGMMSSENFSGLSGGAFMPEGRSERLYRVAFDLPGDTAGWAHVSTERLWTAKTSVKMEVQVRNTPFYQKGVAFGDIVRVRADHERREFVFEDFVSKSGHSTVRIIIKDPTVRGSLEALLRSFDCSWEIDGTGIMWAIDVQPGVNYAAMRKSLVRSASDGKIGIEEAALAEGHLNGLESTDSQ
ncbi:DUF4265 domain-containing protein [Frankia sp. EI5c]|uniref:DUF4265 domain-containing protein n=1 Tax=Frankia sp. EI5c TaxID=683316 RepID=UPI0037C12166